MNFQSTLEKHRDIFHPSRTPKSLEIHFTRMNKKKNESQILQNESTVENSDQPSQLSLDLTNSNTTKSN